MDAESPSWGRVTPGTPQPGLPAKGGSEHPWGQQLFGGLGHSVPVGPAPGAHWATSCGSQPAREGIVPLQSAPLNLHPEHRLQFWALESKRGGYRQARVQRRWLGGCKRVAFEEGGAHDVFLETTRREWSLLEFSTAWRRLIEKMWPDVWEVEGKTGWKWQNAQVARKGIPIEDKEKDFTVRVVKHWSGLLMKAVEPSIINCANS